MDDIIFTAGVPSGRYARERVVRATDYQGVVDTLAATRDASFHGRFVYLNSIGIATPSPAGTLLNLLKRKSLVWRRRAEDEIRASRLDYTIVRAGFLLNRPGGEHALVVGQDALPLAPRHRIVRGDVAETLVEALRHPRASRTTFEIVWGKGPRREGWDSLFEGLSTDRR